MVNVHQAVRTQSDFIALKRFGFSLEKLLERYPQGVPAHIAAAALDVPEHTLAGKYKRIITKLRYSMGVSSDAL